MPCWFAAAVGFTTYHRSPIFTTKWRTDMEEQWVQNAIKSAVSVHISEIRPGDTILHTDGQIRTVCRNNIIEDKFMGTSLFVDSYKSGHLLVKKLRI